MHLEIFCSACKTPDDADGQCTRLDSCKKLRNKFYQKNLSDKDREFLSKSQCDFIDDYPWVCCAIDRNEVPTMTTLPKPGDGVCGAQLKNLNNRIFGGTGTLLGEFPW